MTKKVKIASSAVMQELRRRHENSIINASKPVFDFESYCFPIQKEFFRKPGPRFRSAVCSRRCLAKDTLVLTVSGPKKIQDIKIGEFVYNEFGKPIEVIKTFNNGRKVLQHIVHGDDYLAKATDDHKFLVFNEKNLKYQILAIKKLTNDHFFVKNYKTKNESLHSWRIERDSIDETYDIHVNSYTNLYMLANGLITHNSGKSHGIGADMIDTCLKESNVICLYLTLSKRNARNIIWGILKQIISEYQIDCKPNEVEMSIAFPNGSKINIEGAKDRTEIEKYRGWKIRKAYIDECQSFRNYIEELVNDIIAPALRDLRGELYLTGTPGPIPAGYFYKCSQSPNWNNFKWTAFENPHMHLPPDKDLNITLQEERTLKGISELDAAYRRETFGEWTEDLESLVFKYNENVNHYIDLPPGQYTYIMGVDIGYEDADAIAVLAYSKDHNKVYLVEEHVKAKQTISQLAEAIIDLDNHYNCVKKVIDAGALGKKIVEEIVTRYGITLEAADKKRKMEFIELLNSDLRKGAIKASSKSRFAEDCRLVQWDRDKSTPDRLYVSDTYHSDIADAVLYAYREARHYMYKAPETIYARNTDMFVKLEEDRLAEEMEQRKHTDLSIEISTDEVKAYERLMGF